MTLPTRHAPLLQALDRLDDMLTQFDRALRERLDSMHENLSAADNMRMIAEAERDSAMAARDEAMTRYDTLKTQSFAVLQQLNTLITTIETGNRAGADDGVSQATA